MKIQEIATLTDRQPISVSGYWEEKGKSLKHGKVHFTCINQSAETPQGLFNLDYSLSILEAYKHIRQVMEKSKKVVFIPINVSGHF